MFLALDLFNKAKKADQMNEKRPEATSQLPKTNGTNGVKGK